MKMCYLLVLDASDGPLKRYNKLSFGKMSDFLARKFAFKALNELSLHR